ncbi:MAG: hypothetical protein ABI600_09660 [Luteolibacter sp.]
MFPSPLLARCRVCGLGQWMQQDDALVITPLPGSTPAETVVFKFLTK